MRPVGENLLLAMAELSSILLEFSISLERVFVGESIVRNRFAQLFRNFVLISQMIILFLFFFFLRSDKARRYLSRIIRAHSLFVTLFGKTIGKRTSISLGIDEDINI